MNEISNWLITLLQLTKTGWTVMSEPTTMTHAKAEAALGGTTLTAADPAKRRPPPPLTPPPAECMVTGKEKVCWIHPSTVRKILTKAVSPTSSAVITQLALNFAMPIVF